MVGSPEMMSAILTYEIVNYDSHPISYMQIQLSKQGRIKSGFNKLFSPERHCKIEPRWHNEKHLILSLFQHIDVLSPSPQ